MLGYVICLVVGFPILEFPVPNVIRLPRREILQTLPSENYIVRHEEKTDVLLPKQTGRRVVQVKKTFFDGRNRVEFALEKEIQADEDLSAMLAELELAVNRFFAA